MIAMNGWNTDTIIAIKGQCPWTGWNSCNKISFTAGGLGRPLIAGSKRVFLYIDFRGSDYIESFIEVDTIYHFDDIIKQVASFLSGNLSKIDVLQNLTKNGLQEKSSAAGNWGTIDNENLYGLQVRLCRNFLKLPCRWNYWRAIFWEELEGLFGLWWLQAEIIVSSRSIQR